MSLAALVVAVPLGLVSCGGSDGTTAVDAGAAGAEIVATSDAILIDVRTPDEYASGHLEGAVNIAVEASDFAARIAELDPAGSYVVYCRSGRRSAIAVQQMQAAGFTDITDLGGFEQAQAATGLDVVT